MRKIKLRETLAGIGNDGDVVDVPESDVSWFVTRGFADLVDETTAPNSAPIAEPIGEPEVEKRETAVSAQAATRTRRGRKAK